MLKSLTALTGIALGNYVCRTGEDGEMGEDDWVGDERGWWEPARLPRLDGLTQLTELRVKQTSQLPRDWRRLSRLQVL